LARLERADRLLLVLAEDVVALGRTLLRLRLDLREQSTEARRLLRVPRGSDRRAGERSLQVVELQLGGLADDCGSLGGIVDAGELDHDLVRPLLADLRLGDAELVDALAHDRDRAVERRRVELLPLGGLGLPHHLAAAGPAWKTAPQRPLFVQRGAGKAKRAPSRQCG